jgi:hypothetical protein
MSTVHTHPHEAPHNHSPGGINAMAASATLHCLTGCAIGEIAGLMIGTALGMSVGLTIALSVSLAFLFGYALSTLPLLKSGLSVGAALAIVLAADTLSIVVMEVVDNTVMATIPGAMGADLANPVFWFGMMLALLAAFVAAYPVNRYLLGRGKGHALTHSYHGDSSPAAGVRRFIPSFATATLATAIGAFLIGGLLASLAADDDPAGGEKLHAAGQ